jgi:subtilisin family serine protease
MLGVVAALTVPSVPASAADSASGVPVSLVVGLHAGTDTDAPVDRLTDRTDVDVVDSEALAGASAVTVDVAADEVATATAALRNDPAVSYVEVDQVATASIVPNDPAYADQWGLSRADVPGAWQSTQGSAAVTIAVVDTGVRPVADLAGRVLRGHDFVNNDSNAFDDEGHGTMTAGVLAGAGNNGIGAAGVCWSCRILPVKVLGADGSGSYSDIAEGIRYAADRGAKIINLSLGGSADSRLLRDAVSYAVNKGSLVMAAAGNDGRAAKHYPAAIPAVVAVGASTDGDARYPWSNYGSTWVDIAAPGCNLTQNTAGFVAQFCGTSSATPFAAGVAGLLASVTPAPSAAQIRTALQSSASKLAGNWVSAASGRVDAAAALDALPFWLTGVVPGAALRGTSVTLRPHVGAGSGITEVRATLNGVPAATATAAPWTLTVDTAYVTGAVTLTVSAVAGATSKGSLTLPVVVDRTLPETSFRFPAEAALVRGAVTVGANAWDAVGVAKVQLLVGGTVVASDHVAPFAPRWDSAGHNGDTVLTLRTYDRAGNVRLAYRTLKADNWGPSVVVSAAPSSGTRRIRGLARITAKAADLNGVDRVELLVNGKLVTRYAGAARTFTVDTSRYGPTITVRVRAYDAAGNVRYAPTRTWYR